MLVRATADFSQLRDREYDFPSTCNFPLVDAVLPPDVVLSMTVGSYHKGAALRLPEVAGAVRAGASQLKMVLVAPRKG